MPVWLCLLTYNGCQYHGGCKPLDGTVNSSRSVRIYLLNTAPFSLMQLGTARDSTIGIMTVNVPIPSFETGEVELLVSAVQKTLEIYVRQMKE
jgi:hypothetical protein